MKVYSGDYCYKSTNTGWSLQRRVGKQWKETRYFTTLEGLVDSRLKEEFHKETIGVVYYSTSEDGAFYLLEEVSSRLKAIRDEILGVLNG